MVSVSLDAIRQCLEEYSLPPMIILDVTNVCNLKCIHCPHAEKQSRGEFTPTHLSWDHFLRVMDELTDHDEPCLLRFVGDGEPLLHPRLPDMVDYAKKHSRCIVNLTTNGTLLSAALLERLLTAEIDLIDISIDALTKPVYEQVRRGGSFERLMRGVFRLLDTRKRMSPSTKVMVSFIEQNENNRETEWFRNFWEPLVDYVMMRTLHSASGLAKQQESKSRNRADTRERYPCPHLWKRLTVDFLGRIKFCAHDWESGSVLGNISDTTLKATWKGERLAVLRSEQMNGEYRKNETVCADCSDWASSKWDWGYERLVDRVVMGKPTFLKCLSPLDYG